MIMSYFGEAIALAFVFGGICGMLVALQISGRRYQAAAQRATRHPQ